MNSKQTLETTLKAYEVNAQSSITLLQSFVEYAELCTDPLEVFNYMEKKNICTNMSAFWIQKSRLYCKMGEYSKAIQQLIAAQQKAISTCHNKQDYSKFMTQIDIQLNFIEEQLENAIRKKSHYKRSIEVYEALSNEQQNEKVNPKISSNHSTKSRLHKLLEIYQNQYEYEKSNMKKLFESNQKNKPRCSLGNNLQSSGPKLQRTHSILHKPSFVPLPSQPEPGSPVRQKPKLFRKQTMDSVQIMKRKKQMTLTDIKRDESLLPQDSRMYRTTSVLEGKKVHFGTASNAKIKHTAGPKIQKHVSIDQSYFAKSDEKGVDLREQFSKLKKERPQETKSIEIKQDQEEGKQKQEKVKSKQHID